MTNGNWLQHPEFGQVWVWAGVASNRPLDAVGMRRVTGEIQDVQYNTHVLQVLPEWLYDTILIHTEDVAIGAAHSWQLVFERVAATEGVQAVTLPTVWDVAHRPAAGTGWLRLEQPLSNMPVCVRLGQSSAGQRVKFTLTFQVSRPW